MSTGARPVVREGPPAEARRTIPFDYRFKFDVKRDDVGVTLQQTVDVSVEAAFVAVSMGYALIPAETRTVFGFDSVEDLDTAEDPAKLAPIWSVGTLRYAPRAVPLPFTHSGGPRAVPALAGPPNALAAAVLQGLEGRFDAVPVRRARRLRLADLSAADRAEAAEALQVLPPRAITVGDIIHALSRKLGERAFADRGDVGPQTAAALDAGIRIRPEVARKLLPDAGFEPLDARQLATLFEVMPRPADPVRFLYALHDQGTGRSFQSAPILSLAGLGEDMGRRPFRTFTPAIRFEARSVIRLDVIPRSTFAGELHFVLHGFKVLGGAGTPTGRALRRRHGAR